MAQGVIHILEMVEVEHCDSYFFLISLGLDYSNIQAIGEEFPVGKTRQGIMVGHLPDLFLCLLSLGDIPDHDNNTLAPLKWYGHNLQGESFASAFPASCLSDMKTNLINRIVYLGGTVFIHPTVEVE